MRTSPFQGKGKTTMKESHMYPVTRMPTIEHRDVVRLCPGNSQPGNRRDECTDYSKSKQSHGVKDEATSIHVYVYANPS